MIKKNLFNIIKQSYLIIILLILYLPVFVLILYSFNDSSYSMILKGLSFKWYNSLFNNSSIWLSLINSLKLAFISSSLSTFIATLAATLICFPNFKFKKTLQATMIYMIIVPDIIFAVGLLLTFKFLNIKLGFITLLISHVSFSLPVSLLVIQHRMTELNRNLFLAAQDLGADDYYSFKKIIIPLIKTSIGAAWLLAFILSFDDVIISYFAGGPDYQILPLYIYGLIRTGIKPEINALCSMIFIGSVSMVLLSYKLQVNK